MNNPNFDPDETTEGKLFIMLVLGEPEMGEDEFDDMMKDMDENRKLEFLEALIKAS